MGDRDQAVEVDPQGGIPQLTEELRRAVRALQLEWDGKRVPAQIRSIQGTAELRRAFQQTLMLTPHGRTTFAAILGLCHYTDPEILTDRELTLRNFGAKLMELCGLTSSLEAVADWIATTGPKVYQTEEALRQRQDAERRQQAKPTPWHQPRPGGPVPPQPPTPPQGAQ